MTDWFRSWHGAPTDPKWVLIGRKAGVVPAVASAIAWALFDHASQAHPRGSVAGFDCEVYAAWGGLECDAVTKAVSAMAERGMIDANGELSKWSKRQPEREDGSAERGKAWRERKRTQANADDDAENAQERKRTTEQSRVDTEQIATLNAGTRAELDGLEQQLRTASGLEQSPAPSLADLSPILGLIDAGLDLETEILPVIRAKAKRGVNSWKFFVQACHDSRATRQAAATGAGHSSARAPPPDRRNKVFEALELNLAAMK